MFKIETTPDVRSQMHECGVAPMTAHRIIRRGTRSQHASGALLFSYKGMTAVCDIRDGVYRVFRFYN